eukprot:1140752-Pelagomonas_calceolata.AAC.2
MHFQGLHCLGKAHFKEANAFAQGRSTGGILTFVPKLASLGRGRSPRPWATRRSPFNLGAQTLSHEVPSAQWGIQAGVVCL